MTLKDIINKRKKYLVLSNLIKSFYYSLFFFSLFIFIFIFFPDIMANYGLMNLTFIYSYFTLLIVLPLICIFFKKPFWNINFYNLLLPDSLEYKDIFLALQLEKEKFYPVIKLDNSSLLASNYLLKIKQSLIAFDEYKKNIFPSLKSFIVAIFFTIIVFILLFYKRVLIKNLFLAMLSGLPSQFITTKDSLIFDQIQAFVSSPAYISEESEYSLNMLMQNKLQVLKGSKIKIEAQISLEQKKYKNIKKIVSGNLMLAQKKDIDYFELNILNDTQFSVNFLAPIKGAFLVDLVLENYKGDIYNIKSKIFYIDVVKDGAPSIIINYPSKFFEHIYGHNLEISYIAQDDFGIMEIWLHHRDAALQGDYYKELIARFPKNAPKNYQSTYRWNPIIREGKKINEIVYTPKTQKIEYFLEVKDINIFSEEGVSKSENHFLVFKDIFKEMQNGIAIIRDLIKETEKLVLDLDNKKNRIDYQKKLEKAISVFTSELSEIMPKSKLIQKTRKLKETLNLYNDNEKLKNILQEYKEFLEQYVIVVNMILDIKKAEMAASETNQILSMDINKKNIDTILKKVSELVEKTMHKYKKELKEIKDLFNTGDVQAAKSKLYDLLSKIKEEYFLKAKESQEQVKKISEEVQKRLDKLINQAAELINDQIIVKTITESVNFSVASAEQEIINSELLNVQLQTEALSSAFPFIMGNLSMNANFAVKHGNNALSLILNSKHKNALYYQDLVVYYLKAFIENVKKEKESIEQLSQGNFEDFYPMDLSRIFVFIPKEAVYTIPIDYKSKIIDMSKDRKNINKVKEQFWKEILQ